MRTSPSGISNNGSNGNSFSPSKSSSTCSSPSPSSPVISTPSARKFMEEVWKDISLASLHERSNKTRSSTITTINTTTENPEFCGTSLQDFFTRPLNKDPAKRGASSGATDPSLAVETTFLYTPVPPPTTMLSLNSGSDFAYLESRDPIEPNSQSQWRASFTTPPFVYSLNSAFDAYTNELELEVAHLQEENARLRKQQAEKLCLATTAQLPKMHRISRTSSAPF
ncbi:Protein FD [Morella rubra]|uniref:Protein FD n=1 Tax=Morella rubra TaxID=262757 RepID=A0A6A1UWJ6_9ROSI|nr:Protein FD [Morella rubra]